MKKVSLGLMIAAVCLAVYSAGTCSKTAVSNSQLRPVSPHVQILDLTIRAPGQIVSCSYGTVTIASREKKAAEAEWTSNWMSTRCFLQPNRLDVSCSIPFRRGVELPRFQCELLDPDGHSIRFTCMQESQLREGEAFSLPLGQDYTLVPNMDVAGKGRNCQLL